MSILELFFSILPSLIVSVTMVFFNKNVKKKEEYRESLSEAKIESDHLQLNLNIATAKLSYAVAMAIKRGTPNGEIEEAIEKYSLAMKEFEMFERKQVSRLDVK